GMGNLNRRRAIGAACAAVRGDGGCLSRAAPQRFTAGGRLARAQANDDCALLPPRIPHSPDFSWRKNSPAGSTPILVSSARQENISLCLSSKSSLQARAVPPR
ncbi:hypothetical protein, partial [Bradyrhizobium sp.]|uniref:hypothetical protein n=1 Tax=Bradyrhizobium sp. TaxID=376 RepID=UPI003C5DA455